ncbi:MAG: 16S rRNA (uracil(1498)-N(3))-methyltransferase [Alphaproteobacteria bacterium]|nr:16S rRNA (uracil(1498)-N(3))-methyltransferase [Alphaproteobacteria bacterium]
MQNIPRIYLNENLEIGKFYQLPIDVAHYLTKVMRADKCLVFNNGQEFVAELKQEQSKKIVDCYLLIVNSTNRADPANNLTLAFGPIKQSRLEEMINMATQLGVAKFLPVITDHVTAKHINWERIKKIAIEASEQSGRNSIPEISPEIKFSDFIKENKNIIFADERFAHDSSHESRFAIHDKNNAIVFVGPEGGFSDSEFDALDNSGAVGMSLGPTILRAETAAVAAIVKVISNQ